MFKMAKKILAIDGKSGGGPSGGGHASALDAPRNSSSNKQEANSSKQRGGAKENSSSANQPPVPLHKSINRPPMSTEELNDFSKLEDDPRLPLSVRQIFKITKSWKAIARATSKTGTVMFLNLFEQNKDLFYLFDRFQHLKGKELHESMELREHAATVMSTLDQSINLLSDYDNFVAYLHSIGELHRKVPDFKREHFWKIEQPFLTAVKQTLDERCNETIEQIYKIAIKLIIETIAEGYGKDGQISAPTNPTTLAPSSGSGSGSSGGFGGASSGAAGSNGGKTGTGGASGTGGRSEKQQQGYGGAGGGGGGSGGGKSKQQAPGESIHATGIGAHRSNAAAAGSLLSLSSRAGGTITTAGAATALSPCSSLAPFKTTMAPSDHDCDLLERRHTNDAGIGRAEPPPGGSTDAGETAVLAAPENTGLAAADDGTNYCSEPRLDSCTSLLRRQPQQQPDSPEQHSSGPNRSGANRALFALSQVVGVAAAEAAAVNATCAVAKTAVATATTVPTDDATATAAEMMMMLMNGNGIAKRCLQRRKPFRSVSGAASGHSDDYDDDDHHDCASKQSRQLEPVRDDHNHGPGSGRTAAAAAERCLRGRSSHVESNANANAGAAPSGAANKLPRPSSSSGIEAVFCRSRRLFFSGKEHTRTSSSSNPGKHTDTAEGSARGICEAAAKIAAEAQMDRNAEGNNRAGANTFLHGDNGPEKCGPKAAGTHSISKPAQRQQQQYTVRYKIQTNTRGRSLRKRLAALTSRLLRDAASVGYRSAGTGAGGRGQPAASASAAVAATTATTTMPREKFTSSDRCPYAFALHNVNWGTNKCRRQSASSDPQQQKSNCYLPGERGAAAAFKSPQSGSTGGPTIAGVGVARSAVTLTSTTATVTNVDIAVGEEHDSEQVRRSRERIRVPSVGVEASEPAAVSIETRLQQTEEYSMRRDVHALGGDKDVSGEVATATRTPTTIMDRSNMKVAVNGPAADATDANRRTNIVAVGAGGKECPSIEGRIEKNARPGYYSCVRDAAGTGADVGANTAAANTGASSYIGRRASSRNRLLLAEWFDRLGSQMRPRLRQKAAPGATGAFTGCATSMRGPNKTTTEMTDTKPGSNQPISTPPAAPVFSAAKTAAKTTSTKTGETISAAKDEMNSEKRQNQAVAMNLSADIGELVELIKMIVIALMRHRAAKSQAELSERPGLPFDNDEQLFRQSDIASQLSPLFSESAATPELCRHEYSPN